MAKPVEYVEIEHKGESVILSIALFLFLSIPIIGPAIMISALWDEGAFEVKTKHVVMKEEKRR